MRTTDEHTNWTQRPDGSSNPYLIETAPTLVATWGYGAIAGWLLVRIGMPLPFVIAFLELDQVGDFTTLWAADVLLLVGCGLYLLDGVKEGIRWLLHRAVAWWVTRIEKQAESPAVDDITIIELEMDRWFWSGDYPTDSRGCQSHGQNGQGGA